MANIIIVEPAAETLTSVARTIKSKLESNTVESFSDVDSAIDFLSENAADIIITDVFPPKGECTKITDLCAGKYPHAKIILTSTTEDFTYAQMAVRCTNVVDFLIMPNNFDELIPIISRLARTFDALKADDGCSAKKHELFSNIVHGYTTNIDEIKRCFDYLGLNISLTDQPCTLIHFHMQDFISHIHAQKGQTPEQFYDAVSGAVPFETEEAYCSLANYSYGNFSWFVVHKGCDGLPKRIDNVITMFKSTFENKLCLATEVSSRKTWFSISDMLQGLESAEFKAENKAQTPIEKALGYMRQNYHKNLSLATVAAQVNMSPIYFSTYFKKHTGMGFVNMLNSIRIEQVAKLLVTTNMTIKDIKIAVGYDHAGNFYKHFQDRYNMTPNEYKKWYFGK